MPQIPTERLEHGNRCDQGIHVPYRVRTPQGGEVRCKLCYHVQTVNNQLREEVAA